MIFTLFLTISPTVPTKLTCMSVRCVIYLICRINWLTTGKKYFELCWNQLCTCWRIGATKWHDLTNFFFVLFFKDDMPNFLKSFQTTGKQTVEHTHVCLLFKLVQHTIIWESFSSSTWIPSWTMILKICAKFYN